jgi:predicted ATP-grasp superfamily ATP-dependent carboligase
MPAYTLIIICRNEYDESDFRVIAERVAAQASDIRPVVLRAFSDKLPPGDLWSRPVLIVALSGAFDLVPQRGTVLKPKPIFKTDQYQLFLKAGLATPKTRVFEFGMKLDPDEFGEHVILKPLRINSKGLGIHLVRTKRVGALSPQLFKARHPIHKDVYLVQQFIDTGDYPTHYRVETLLGEALCCRTIFSTIKRPALEASDRTLLDGVVASNAVRAGSNKTAAARDEEVIDFARKMDHAIPGCPLKGCDVLREARTGKLYALECNPGGNSWAFSAPDGENARQAFGGKQGMIDHLGAWDAAARGLILRTRAEAK